MCARTSCFYYVIWRAVDCHFRPPPVDCLFLNGSRRCAASCWHILCKNADCLQFWNHRCSPLFLPPCRSRPAVCLVSYVHCLTLSWGAEFVVSGRFRLCLVCNSVAKWLKAAEWLKICEDYMDICITRCFSIFSPVIVHIPGNPCPWTGGKKKKLWRGGC
jgi:hypothetical protein